MISVITEITPVNIVTWIFSGLAILFSIYTWIKNGAKDEKKDAKASAIDTTTLIVKLENIQQSINKMGDTISYMQTKMESLDHRLVVVETKLALGMVDATRLDL